MRNLKRVLALAMALVMTLAMMVIGSSAASYTDAETIDTQYAEAIEVLTGMGVFQGTGNGVFAPKAVLTRAEAATLIYRVITGDVTDAQTKNYAYKSLKDVKGTEWYAGYVTYAANGGYIKGDENGNFNATDKVTGIQVMAIMLRAAGYGQNGEYEGAGWKDNILTDAYEAGMIGSISTATLNAPATRELVAQLIFNALTEVNMVTYTPALGYVSARWLNTNTSTLGEKVFGLNCKAGIVVGNQATGEDYTLVAYNENGVSYKYADAKVFYTTTGLDLFGHAVKVWNDGYGHVYAMFDKATLATIVVAEDANLGTSGKLLAAVKNAGFSSLSADAYWSNSYDAFRTARYASAQAVASKLYAVISNNAIGTVDAVIKLDIQIAKISVIDTTNVKGTLTLSGSSFGTNGVIAVADLTAGSATGLGTVVIANKIHGTNGTATYSLDAVTNTVTGKVVAVDNNTGKVILSDGTTIEKSPLYNVVKGNCIAQVANWSNATYDFTLDNNGKYLGAKLHNDNTFIYGTFADYASAGTSTGTVNYYLTGVTLDGQIVTSDITKAINASEVTYANLNVAKKAWSSNIIATGTHTGYAIDSNGALTTTVSGVGVNTMKKAKTITKTNVTAGYLAMNGNSLFMTNATKFIVVSGTGTDTLKVTTYNGISELLGSADQVTIAGSANVYYTTSAYIYNSVAGATNHIDTVILGADDLTYVTSSDLYYAAAVKPGVTDSASTAVQYELYKDGVASYYYLTSEPTADTFYTLTEVGKTADGETKYSLTSTTTNTLSGNYVYVGATSNLDTAVIADQLKTVTGATVVNLVSTSLNLGSIKELNNAVSSGYNVTVDCVTNNVGVSIIYVTGATK